MFVEFDSLPDSCRLWVYQSARKFTEQEEHTLSQALTAFTQQWTAHGKPLKSSFKVVYNQFILLAADESFNEASGCSIDDSVHAIKEIDQHFKFSLFDRTSVACLIDEEVIVIRMKELSASLKQEIWNQDTLVFNNSISTKGDIKTNWILPAKNTWLNRYLAKQVV
jgi:hypothetical protein